MKKDIHLLGLSEYKTRALRALLENGPSSINQLAKRSGLPTSKLYEIISQLSMLGFVRVIQQRPLRVEAADFRAALKSHFDAKKAELERIQDELEQLTIKSHNPVSQFEVVHGRDAFFHRVKAAVSESKHEICAIVRNYRLDFDLRKRIETFVASGGRIRLIGPKAPAQTTRHWISAGAQIRFLEVPSTRFTIWDAQRTAIGFKDQSYDYFSLWINDAIVAASFVKMFEEYWTQAKKK